MNQKILPETPTLPLEATRIRPLLRDALRAARRDFESVTPGADEWVIFRPGSDGLNSERVSAPNYRTAFNHLAANSAEGKALTDYLWERGAFKASLHRDDGQHPTQEGWATVPWSEIVWRPLLHLTNLAAAKDFVALGSFRAWRVDDDDLEAAVDDLVDQLCERHCTIQAISPIANLRPEDGPCELEPGVFLETWSPETRSLFLTQYRKEYLSDDSRSWSSFGAIRIKTRAAISDDGSPATATIAATMDRLKWALMMTMGAASPFNEGPVVIRTPSGGRVQTLRRADPLAYNRAHVSHSVRAPEAEKLRALLANLRAVSMLSEDFDAALWAFGRACNAQLSRDILLDAAIGLEMLLLPKEHGESTYKFRLHGLAIIADENPDALYKDLGDIYGLRSKAAHGAASGEHKFRADAERARTLLGKAILSAVMLAESKQIDLHRSKRDIGDAVTAFVRARLTRPT
jgi:hypothetical protein